MQNKSNCDQLKSPPLSCKLVMIGEYAVGKSSVSRRFSQGIFTSYQESTIGAAFIMKSVQVGDGAVQLEIWVN